MANFESMPLLVIDQQPVSFGQTLSYLQTFGRLQPFIQDALRHHVLLRAFAQREDLAVTTAELGQATIDFRLQNQLSDQSNFQAWLSAQGLAYATFEQQIVIRLKLDKLKGAIAAAQIDDYYNEHQQDFEQVDLQYLLVSDEAIANELKASIEAGETFDQIALRYPLNEEKVMAKRDVLRRQQLRPEIRESVADVPMHTLVGPIEMGTRWCLCRVEQTLPTALDDALYQELTELFFEQWLAEQLQEMSIEAAKQPAEGEASLGGTSSDDVSDDSSVLNDADLAEELSEWANGQPDEQTNDRQMGDQQIGENASEQRQAVGAVHE